jgi:hydrogenase maturation protease
VKPPTPILVAGIGNIFFGDDAFGCEVVRELVRQSRPWPAHVRVEDFGIRSYDLAYAIMEGVDTILIDAVSRGQPPGTLYLIEPDLSNLGPAVPDGHTMNLVNVLATLESLGGRTRQLYLVGCEPAVLETEDGHLGLSPVVQDTVPGAIALIERVVADLIYGRNPVHHAPSEPALTPS